MKLQKRDNTTRISKCEHAIIHGTQTLPRIKRETMVKQDGLEVVKNRIFVDFGMIFDLFMSVVWDRNVKKIGLFKLVPKSFLYRFLTRDFDVWDFQNVVSAWKVLQKPTFHGNRF